MHSRFTFMQKLYLFVGVILAISLYAGLADYDWYWQVELGKKIVTEFNFNGVYDLHWGNKGVSEYLDHEWLTNILFYLCSCTGKYGISVAKVMICIAYGVATCYYLSSFDKEGFDDTAVIGICGYLFIMATVFIKVKAYILSVAFLLVEVTFLRKYKESRDKWYFVYMFILCVLWNNMHSGSIPLFFLVAFVYWATELKFDRVVLLRTPAYLFSLALTPWGYKLVLFDIMHNFDPVMKEIILDWRCIDAKEELGVLCALTVLVVVFLTIKTDIRKHAFDLIMGGVVLFMSFQSARHLIYLAPFLYSILIGNKYEFKLNDTVRWAGKWFCVGIAVLSLIQGFNSKTYEKSYGMKYIESGLFEKLVETNEQVSDGLYANSEIALWEYGLKQFTSGAFPAIRERRLAEYELVYSASPQRIEEIISEYELTKFLGVKYNPAVTFSEGPGLLYEYLASNDDYELVYDSDFYYYFVRKDLLV